MSKRVGVCELGHLQKKGGSAWGTRMGNALSTIDDLRTVTRWFAIKLGRGGRCFVLLNEISSMKFPRLA
jgi:hypothetical protein